MNARISLLATLVLLPGVSHAQALGDMPSTGEYRPPMKESDLTTGRSYPAVLISDVVQSRGLCGFPSADADPLQIREDELTPDRYHESLSFLRQGLKDAMRRHVTVEDLRQDIGFGIQYANAVLAVEGYVLALKATHDEAELGAFCSFLRSNHWVD